VSSIYPRLDADVARFTPERQPSRPWAAGTGPSLPLERDQAEAVREPAVAGVDVRIASLEHHLEVARVDRESLVGIFADDVAVADVVGPVRREGDVLFDCELVGEEVPRTVKVRRGPGAEVARGPLRLDDHQVLVRALDLV